MDLEYLGTGRHKGGGPREGNKLNDKVAAQIRSTLECFHEGE